MSKHLIDTEAVTVSELKEAVDLTLTPDYDEGGQYIPYDAKLLDALMTVIEYFSIPSEFDEYKADITSRRLKMEGALATQKRL